MTSNPPCRAHRLRLVATLVVAALAAACGNITQLYADDASSPLVTARAVYRLGGGPGGGGIELEGSTARARGEDPLGEFASASLGGSTVLGPTLLKHTARVQQAQLFYSHLLFAGRPVEMEWFVGGAWAQTSWQSLSARPGDPRLSARSHWYGPAGGALARLRMNPSLALEVRASGAVDVSGRRDGGTSNSAEVALAFKPVPALALRAGYGLHESSVRPAESLATELSVRARGLFLGLGLEF